MNQVAIDSQPIVDQKEITIFFMNYLGYTYEDGAAVSESYAKKEGSTIGDKIVQHALFKGIISHIIPDTEMPYQKSDGKRADILLNPISGIKLKTITEKRRNIDNNTREIYEEDYVISPVFGSMQNPIVIGKFVTT